MERSNSRVGRREVSRAQVEATALDLFRQHGVDRVTVEQICATANVAPATFYRYFGTKDGVLFAYRPRFLEAIREAVGAVPAAAEPADQLRSILLHFAEFLDQHSDDITTRDSIVAHNPVLLPSTLLIQREWENELAGALSRARGLPATDEDAWRDAALGLIVVRSAFRRWRSASMPTIRQAVMGSFDDMLLALDRRRPTIR